MLLKNSGWRGPYQLKTVSAATPVPSVTIAIAVPQRSTVGCLQSVRARIEALRSAGRPADPLGMGLVGFWDPNPIGGLI